MEPFQQRLLDEKNQVDERITKLESFTSTDLFDQLPAVQMSLLNIQLKAMQTYSQCLLERIAYLAVEA